MGQEFDRNAMKRLVRGLQTKSDKIRRLRSAKFTRGEIARFLGVRPQFVRNVEVYDRHRKARKPPATDALTMEGATMKVRLRRDGQLLIPPEIREKFGLKEGDTLWVEVGDGELRLITARAITREVQAITRRYIPEGVSLSDELIAERRREAAREMEK